MPKPWACGDPIEDWKPLGGRTALRSVTACERQEWTTLVWPRNARFDAGTGELRLPDGAALPRERPFLCGSWRCRRCARWRGASDFVRVRSAVLSRPWWVYVVLTFDPSAFGSPWAAYREGGRCWDRHLRQGLRRKGGRIAYVQTWEAHRSRWPHCNLLLSGDRLQAWVESGGIVRRRSKSGRSAMLPKAWRQELRAAAIRAGFGPVVWAEVLNGAVPERMAGYFVKLARELTGSTAGGKVEQSPTDAPPGFRRIRASRGLLPPSKLRAVETSELTGRVLPHRCSWDDAGPRAAGRPAAFAEAKWSSVVDVLERESRELAQAWPSFFDPSESADPGHVVSEV